METKLSKTLYMEGLRCPRLLWYRINQPGLANSPDLVAQYLYQEGHKVEEHARRLYPGGILINKGYPAPDTCLEKETQIAMQSRVPAVYEASFSKGSCNCRTDIMHKFNGGSWNLTEVKMCSRLKPEHIDDVAFQLNCIKETDYHIDRAYLLHVNTKYIRRGEINPHQLFTTVDITAKAREQIEHVQNNIQSLVHFAQVKVPPPNVYGRHCEKPGKCPFYDSCIKDHTEGSVYDLPYGRDIIPRLISMGITRLADIPSDFTLSKRQSALVASVRIGSPVINQGVIRAFLKNLQYPLYFLDFETISPCVPLLDGTSPYKRLPFQFSLHIQTEEGLIQHFEYLPIAADDPREQLIEKLTALIGGVGSIVAWNAGFEKAVLSGLASTYPKYSTKINQLLPRFIDLMIPFKSGSYTDYRFRGSASIKKVLPVLVSSLSYAGLSINRGDEASLAFQKYIEGSTTAKEWAILRKDLLAYCKLDTWAMLQILQVLYHL